MSDFGSFKLEMHLFRRVMPVGCLVEPTFECIADCVPGREPQDPDNYRSLGTKTLRLVDTHVGVSERTPLTPLFSEIDGLASMFVILKPWAHVSSLAGRFGFMTTRAFCTAAAVSSWGYGSWPAPRSSQLYTGEIDLLVGHDTFEKWHAAAGSPTKINHRKWLEAMSDPAVSTRFFRVHEPSD